MVIYLAMISIIAPCMLPCNTSFETLSINKLDVFDVGIFVGVCFAGPET